MSIHEYAVSILSIVLGLGIANLLGGIAWMARNPSNNMYFYIFGTWSLSILMATIGMWWGIWAGFKDLTVLSFWSFLPAFLSCALLYLASKILVPENGEATKRLDENFPSVAKPLCLCIASVFIVAGLRFPTPTFYLELEAILGVALIIIALTGMIVKTPSRHASVALAWLIVFLVQQATQPNIL